MQQIRTTGCLILLVLGTAACGSSDSPKIDTTEDWAVSIISGFEAACSQVSLGGGSLENTLFSGCDGTVEWESLDGSLFGSCADSRYPVLPGTSYNPNPDNLKLRVRILDGCLHPDFANDLDCDSDDPNIRERALATIVIEYKDGLYPVLPGGNIFCPLQAVPANQ